MDCHEARDLILLIVYGGADEAERRQADAHLGGCPACRLVLAEERRLQAFLSQRPPAEPSADLLARCRADLGAALRAEAAPGADLTAGADLTVGAGAPAGAAARRPVSREAGWLGALGRLWDRPRLSPAFAALLLVFGFLGGSFAAGRGLVTSPFPGRPAASPAKVQPEDPAAAAASLSSLAVDPDSGRVSLSYDTLKRTQVEGAVTDPAVRRLLVATVRDSFNAGLRLDAIDALGRSAADAEVRQALLGALKDDRNAGARLKAIDALEARAPVDPEVRGAILQALLRDRNPGVRVRAVDALTAARGPEILPAMQRLAQEDSDSYVRLRSGAFVESMDQGKVRR